MDLPRLEALTAHWRDKPPVHISLAGFLGYGKSRGTSNDAGDVEALLAGLPMKEFQGG